MSDFIYSSNTTMRPYGNYMYTDPSGRDIYESYDAGNLREVEVRALPWPNKKAIAYEMEKRRNELRRRNTLPEDDPRVVRAKRFQEEQQALRAIANMQIDGRPQLPSESIAGPVDGLGAMSVPTLPLTGSDAQLQTYFPIPTRVTPSIEVLQPRADGGPQLKTMTVDIMPQGTYAKNQGWQGTPISDSNDPYDSDTYIKANALDDVVVTAPYRNPNYPKLVTDWGKIGAKIAYDQTPEGRAGKIGFYAYKRPTLPQPSRE